MSTRRKNIISGVSLRKNGPPSPSESPDRQTPSTGLLVEKGTANDVFTVKGFGDNDGDLVINISQIRHLLISLKPHSKLLIKNLSGEEYKNFHQVVDIISVAYKTAAYATILQTIEEIFQEELSANNTQPGTIAAYFVGCRLKTTFRIPGCSAICAGAVPLDPSSSNWDQCTNLVMLYDSDSHIFTALNNADNEMRVNAYIFIPSSVNFTGFNSDEEEKLKQYGITNVRLVKYESNGIDYKAMTDNFIPLTQVPSLVQTGNGGSSSTSSTSSTSSDPSNSSQGYNIDMILVILLIVILIILVLFIAAKILMC